MTDMMKNLADIMTDGKADLPRYYDLFNEKTEQDTENEETPDDVIARIMQNFEEMGS